MYRCRCFDPCAPTVVPRLCPYYLRLESLLVKLEVIKPRRVGITRHFGGLNLYKPGLYSMIVNVSGNHGNP